MEPAKTIADKPQTSWLRRFLRKFVLYAVLAIVLYLLVVYLLAAVFVYSKGDRIGYIYKFSNKGYLFKTNEGILKTGFVNISAVCPREVRGVNLPDKTLEILRPPWTSGSS